MAGYGKRGKIWVNPNVPKSWRGIKMRNRLMTHEKVERKLRLEKGYSYRKAHKEALKAEHEGLTKKQIAKYSGKLGAIAKHHPRGK